MLTKGEVLVKCEPEGGAAHAHAHASGSAPAVAAEEVNSLSQQTTAFSSSDSFTSKSQFKPPASPPPLALLNNRPVTLTAAAAAKEILMEEVTSRKLVEYLFLAPPPTTTTTSIANADLQLPSASAPGKVTPQQLPPLVPTIPPTLNNPNLYFYPSNTSILGSPSIIPYQSSSSSSYDGGGNYNQLNPGHILPHHLNNFHIETTPAVPSPAVSEVVATFAPPLYPAVINLELEKHLIFISSSMLAINFSSSAQGNLVQLCNRAKPLSRCLKHALCAMGCFISIHPSLFPGARSAADVSFEDRKRVVEERYPVAPLVSKIEKKAFTSYSDLLDTIRAANIMGKVIYQCWGLETYLRDDFYGKVLNLFREYDLLNGEAFGTVHGAADGATTIGSTFENDFDFTQASATSVQSSTGKLQYDWVDRIEISKEERAERVFLFTEVLRMDLLRSLMFRTVSHFQDWELPFNEDIGSSIHHLKLQQQNIIDHYTPPPFNPTATPDSENRISSIAATSSPPNHYLFTIWKGTNFQNQIEDVLKWTSSPMPSEAATFSLFRIQQLRLYRTIVVFSKKQVFLNVLNQIYWEEQKILHNSLLEGLKTSILFSSLENFLYDGVKVGEGIKFGSLSYFKRDERKLNSYSLYFGFLLLNLMFTLHFPSFAAGEKKGITQIFPVSLFSSYRKASSREIIYATIKGFSFLILITFDKETFDKGRITSEREALPPPLLTDLHYGFLHLIFCCSSALSLYAKHVSFDDESFVHLRFMIGEIILPALFLSCKIWQGSIIGLVSRLKEDLVNVQKAGIST